MNTLTSHSNSKSTLSMNPLKFAMWLFIVSIIMIFGALTSAFLVRKAEGNWFEFDLPISFTVNTLILFLSSIFMQLSLNSAKKDDWKLQRIYILFTVLLGFIFVVGQYISWGDLVDMKVFFAGTSSNPSGSFLYVISGLHAFHLLTGLIYLIIVFFMSIRLKIHSKKLIHLEMCTTYWHFLDGLWIYLFLFLKLNH